MRWTMAAAALLAANPAAAQGVDIASAVYLERVEDGASRVVPAIRLSRGDRVVAILSWDAPATGSYTVTSPIPAGLALESTSRGDIEVSLDQGRTWRQLASPDAIPAGATHLRWTIGGDGRLSYRAVVR
jgi:hypothetical protein